ncbi:MAG: HDOD domain-containing protein [Desulfamplus sp.]|nr:HDOD domain-containing protein [Desulfamplus sp.]
MIQTFDRLILKSCSIGTDHAHLCRFIVKEFKISPEKADFIVRNPPAVLGDFSTPEQLDLARQYLYQMDVECDVVKVVKDRRLPFAINPRHLKSISKEFSKTLRACVETAMFYVTVEPGDESFYIRSLLGRQDEIEDAFRYSDSVVVVDDVTFILLGFASDREGSDVVFDKIVYCIETYIHRDAVVSIGLAVMPEDGKSFYDLMSVAKKNMVTFKNDLSGVHKKSEASLPDKESSQKKSTSLSDIQIFSLCFNMARGKFYNELTELPPDVLWGALSKISISDQKKFFLKLPHDSPLTPYLAEKIKNQSDESDIRTARKTVRRVINKMQLLENLKDRKDNRKKVISLLNQVESIFTMPSIALQVYQVASNPNSEIEDIVNNIVLDPSLTIKILKIVNSPFYGLSEKISSIKEAVVMLGRDEIINMAFGLSLSRSFLDADLKGVMDPEIIWQHSMETALIAKYICRDMPQFKNLGIFTAGLLHDLGKAYLVENFSELYITIISQGNEHGLLTSALEQEVLGIDHGGIGKLIGDNWNLPDSLVHAVAFHHQPSAALKYSPFAAVIGFADYAAHMVNARQNKDNIDHAQINRIKKLLKVDHMIAMKKLFPDFNNEFIEQIFDKSANILKDNRHLFNIS